MNQSINTDRKNSKEPQQKYRLGTVSIKILGGLNRFYRRLTSPSASIMAQNIQLFGPRGGFLTHLTISSVQNFRESINEENKEAINNFASYLHCAMTWRLHKARNVRACRIITVMNLCFRTDMPGQTVQTRSDQSLHCLPFRLHHLDSLLYDRAT